MYLLPAIDILGGKAVRLAKGDYDRVTVYNDDPVAQARAFEQAGAHWVHVVDLDGARSGMPENAEIVERIVAETHLMVEVGGGIRSIETLERLRAAGASRAILGTALVRDEEFARAAVERFGDFVGAGIDAKNGEAAVDGWRKGTSLAAVDLARHVAKLGYKHLVYTDIARDGMQTGIDAASYERMARAFGNPVIASGGVASIDDLCRLQRVSGCIEGVIAGRAVYEGTLDVAQACELLRGLEAGAPDALAFAEAAAESDELAKEDGAGAPESAAGASSSVR
jgi:phosphoribosylformimino-5-aminoimidazole carboxamide ribotide isomerase